MKTFILLLLVAIVATSCTDKVKVKFSDNTVTTFENTSNQILTAGDSIVVYSNNAGYSGIDTYKQIKHDTTIDYTSGITIQYRKAEVVFVK